MKNGIAFFVSVSVAVMSVFAASVTEMDVRTAATKFVTSDPIGSVIFSGRTISGIRDADGLWIVSLTPAGHIIFSGSDLVEPIVGFSPTDFADPDPESPVCAMLDGSRAASLVAETSGAEIRNAKWEKLLERKNRTFLRADSVEPATEAIVVPPFLQSHYDQLQPYNDFCPIYDSNANTTRYRGRTPCGCVATVASQVFRHFKWPARIDQNLQYNHSFFGTNGIETTFPICFNGHVPIDWNALDDTYINWSNGYDLRNIVAESVRYPIARLVLYADVMAQMEFNSIGSGANYNTVASNVAEWYTQGAWVDMQDSIEQMRSNILAGVPCPISLTEYDQFMNPLYGHVVVAHGWAEDGTTQYAYINFGWSGANDGYYNVAEDFQSYQEKKAYVGHYPRAKPQIDPLPKVCGPNITLNWHFPDFYTNNLTGFTVAVSKAATIPTTFLDDFLASEGVSSDSNIYVSQGADGKMLYSDYAAIGSYTYPKVFTLTSASVLTFKVSSYAAISSTLEVQAKFGDGDWQTISAPTLERGFSSPNWETCRVYLGGHGGESAKFRILRNWGGLYYYDNDVDRNRVDYGYVLLDDFQVTDVLEQETASVYGVNALERNFVLPQLNDGASYFFTVTPEMNNGALMAGEASDPVLCVVAGECTSPVPGEQTYHQETLSFSTTDTSGVWSYSYDNYGSVANGSSVKAPWACFITATLSGRITTASSLSFQWSASNYYGDGADTVSAIFIDESGNETTIWSVSNSANVSSKQNVNLSLSSFAGQSGRIRISYSHSGSAYTSQGGVLYSPTISNIQVPTVPAVAWDTVMLTDLGAPSILAVSNVVNGVAVASIREGFCRECRYGMVNEFDVECSEYVTNLVAYSSHLALVGQGQVTTQRLGPHTFRVSVDASGISEAQSRSRMILTLEATDANGTKAYKDLSLRFSLDNDPLEMATSETLPPATVGEPYTVELAALGGIAPYTWSAVTSAGYDDSRSESSFSEVGTMRWENIDEDNAGELVLSLPFDFPFYGSTYRTVHVNPNGALTFNGFLTNSDSWGPRSETFRSTAMIAAHWQDSVTSIYVDESSSEAVTIRWSGVYWNTSNPVSFSATLYANGRVRLCYGDGNYYGGMIGISSGNGNDYTLVLEINSGSMSNAQDIVFTPWSVLPAGFSLSPTGVLSGTPTESGETSLTVFVTDAASTKARRTFNLTVEQPVEPLEVTTSSLPPATVGVPYSVTLEAIGGVGAYSWSAASSDGYDESRLINSFSVTGTAMGWQEDDGCWNLNLPFDFPFYGSAYSNVWVNSNGTLTFDGYFTAYTLDGNVLSQHPMIAVLWGDLDMRSGDIYVASNSTESVTIRWSGIYYNSTAVSFSATLYADGTIRLRYGAGNANGGMIGVSSGNYNNSDYILSSVSGSSSMNNEQDVVFTPYWALPEGLSLSSVGILSGTPVTADASSFTVFVTDGAGARIGRTLNLMIEAPINPLEIVTREIPSATNGMPYSVTLEATGGVGAYTWIGGDSYGYDAHSQSGSSFNGTTGTETAMGWQANLFDDVVSWKLDLPFDFPFYGSTYSNVWVSSHGTLTFDGYFSNWYPSEGSLSVTKMIAALWMNIDTSSGDIYVESSAEAVTVRWSGVYWNTSDPVSFSATLYPDGRVRLSYGAGNANGGWIGVSSGKGLPFYTLAAECNSESTINSMNNAHDIVFTPWSPLPEWLSLSYGGVLSGTPTSAGTMSIHVYVMDEGVTEVSRTLDLTVEAALATATENTPEPVPYTWLDTYFPAASTSTFGYDGLAMLDSDGDGYSNWEEYVLQTNPTNAESKLSASISMENGVPVVSHNLQSPLDGYRAVIKGSNDLKAPLENWVTITAPTGVFHFFKVVVEPVQ